MSQQISKKIASLNQTTLESLIDSDRIKIIEHFTETGIKILGADFGFAWWKASDTEKYNLIYKSVTTPYEPELPRERGGNFEAKKTRAPFFVENVISKNYEKKYDISPYMKSYVIIPITYKDFIYGNLVLCYKIEHLFSNDDRELAASLGNTTAQSITIHRLIEKEREARLIATKQEAYFKALVENSYEVIMIVDENGHIKYVSSSVENVCGIKPEVILKHRARELIYKRNDKKIDIFLKNIIENPGVTHTMQFEFKHYSGDLLYFEMTAKNLLRNENVGGIVLNIHDITEKRRAEMLRETERLLKEERLKTEFIANATHEIRTPLAIIRGNSDIALLNKDKPSKYYVKSFKAINREVEHLSNMITDLTLLTSKEATLNEGVIMEKIDFSKIVLNTIRRCQTLARNKNITIKSNVKVGIIMMGDKTYLEKLVLNLIRNSINYGKVDGWVEVNVRMENTQMKMVVSDNGIGIAEDDLPHIFERFYRADKSHHPDGNSIGLGLAIVKWIVIAHGGTINLKSEVGKGTEFIISLPILN